MILRKARCFGPVVGAFRDIVQFIDGIQTMAKKKLQPVENNPREEAQATLREAALRYPETIEDFPWGESAFKVKGKVFLFMSNKEQGILAMSMKLPSSNSYMLTKPFAAPTGYGLGKSGWVTMKFEGADEIPVDLLLELLDESFRAVAPKKLVATLDD
jgi:predicted DNA-binding protein (MmcQ/YjbR family)